MGVGNVWWGGNIDGMERPRRVLFLSVLHLRLRHRRKKTSGPLRPFRTRQSRRDRLMETLRTRLRLASSSTPQLRVSRTRILRPEISNFNLQRQRRERARASCSIPRLRVWRTRILRPEIFVRCRRLSSRICGEGVTSRTRIRRGHRSRSRNRA